MRLFSSLDVCKTIFINIFFSNCDNVWLFKIKINTLSHIHFACLDFTIRGTPNTHYTTFHCAKTIVYVMYRYERIYYTRIY